MTVPGSERELDLQNHWLSRKLLAYLFCVLFRGMLTPTAFSPKPQAHFIAPPPPHRSFPFPCTTLTSSSTLLHYLCCGFSPPAPPPSLLSHTKRTHLHILTYLQYSFTHRHSQRCTVTQDTHMHTIPFPPLVLLGFFSLCFALGKLAPYCNCLLCLSLWAMWLHAHPYANTHTRIDNYVECKSGTFCK